MSTTTRAGRAALASAPPPPFAIRLVEYFARLSIAVLTLTVLFTVIGLPRTHALWFALLAVAVGCGVLALEAFTRWLFPSSPWLGPCPIDRRPKHYRSR